MTTLRNEIEAQKRMLSDRRRQNTDLTSELNRIHDTSDSRKAENVKLRADLLMLKDQNDHLNIEKRNLADEGAKVRESNIRSQAEIDSLNATLIQKTNESNDLQQKIKVLEYDLSKSV